MNDASTMQPPSTETHGTDTNGLGHHRGPQSSHDGDTAPHGRHRRPTEQSETAAA